MRVVHYGFRDPWVGRMRCPRCARETPAWRSSGMSQSCPHFYCDTCSNAIHREGDQEKVMREDPSKMLLDAIAATLPKCPCGGRFNPGTNPKCPHCGFEFKHSAGPVERLTDPNVILLDDACLIRDRLCSYKVSIGPLSTWFVRVLMNLFC